MRVCIFDPGTGGHHPSFVAGVADAALGAGHDVVLATPELPDGLSGRAQLEWVHTEPFSPRNVSKGRRVLRRAAAMGRASGSDTFWNLNLDESIWALGNSLDGLAAVHVLHHVSQYSYASRSMVGRARTVYLRRALRRLAATEPLLVHTRRAADVLGTFLGPADLATCGLPVQLSARHDWRFHDASEGRTLLFVGQARPNKGLPVLLEAASLLNNVAVEVVGVQDPEARQPLQTAFAQLDVRWIDRFVSDEELAEAYRRAALVVLPYLESFAQAGHASGVLLEALASAQPIVTTEAMTSQLPPRYEGAVVVQPGDATDLARGIDRALQELDVLRSASARGRDFVRRHHSYEAYVTRLTELSQTAAATSG